MTADIHDRARELVRQSRGAMGLAAAYRELSRRGAESRRRAKYGTLRDDGSAGNAFANVESPRPLRQPYRDD